MTFFFSKISKKQKRFTFRRLDQKILRNILFLISSSKLKGSASKNLKIVLLYSSARKVSSTSEMRSEFQMKIIFRQSQKINWKLWAILPNQVWKFINFLFGIPLKNKIRKKYLKISEKNLTENDTKSATRSFVSKNNILNFSPTQY